MKICDFCSTAKILMDFIGESKNIKQIDFMYELFKDFMESDEAKDFDFDNGLVCRWLNGTAKLSPKITAYYSALGNLEAMAIDIEENILPLFYDKDMAVTELYDLLMSDTTVSETKKQELADNYPYKDDADISNFISKLVFFGMERKFIKRDANTKKLIASGALSPQTKDYIYSLVPKPCKHFCGRDNELEKLHTMLEDENKIFIQGIAGIGKSEFVKMYAQKYKKEYTNILYFSYGGSLKQMITDCDFADDSLTDGKNILLKKHNRFLRSLKEDTLIIIDNFNITASDDELFDVIMKYRCKILFTTRSRFKDYTYFELKEMPLESLLTLSEYFYADTRSNTNVVENIINELHYHTLSVELAARLLTSGILEPCRLLTELQSTKSVLHTDDKINIVKDGTSSKATYYEHIHKLLSLIGLSDKAVKIMRCMTLIPYDGINPRMLAKWIGLNNLNTINELIEYGFIQENDYRKITLHPLIQEIAIDDTKPGISSCINLIEAVRILCLYHGLDLPYHTLLFKIAENTIDIANNDDTERYKLFLKDVFAYMEKYAYRSGMELIISELQSLVDTNEDKAILLDYKAAYEHICNKNHKKALQYEQRAVKLCEEIATVNPHLAANIYGNIGGLYHTENQLDKAKYYMELAYQTLVDSGIDFTNDAVIQVCNYANLAASMGEPRKAIQALKRCANAVKEYNSENSSDYANLAWDIGCIYTQMRDKDTAVMYFKTALRIYTDLWANEPELLQMKLTELKNMAAVYGVNIKNLISAN